MKAHVKKMSQEKAATTVFVISMVVAWLVPVNLSLEKIAGLPVGILPFSRLCGLANNCMPSVSTYFACMMLMTPYFVYLLVSANIPKPRFTLTRLLQGTAGVVLGALLIWHVFYEYLAVESLLEGKVSGQILLRFFLTTRIGMGLIGGMVFFAVSVLLYGAFMVLPREWVYFIRGKKF